ncbi:MAG: esterase [Devosia sp.]
MTLTLKEMGSFYVGGRMHTVAGKPTSRLKVAPSIPEFTYDPNGEFAVEHAYVQYFIPQDVKGLPILLIHGGALTGATWETTPDGREGWVNLLLRRGRAVYVADMVERGRAGWTNIEGVFPGPILERSAQEAWWLFRFGMEDGFESRSAFVGQKFPIDAFDTFMKQCVPRWILNVDTAQAAFLEMVRRIGPCVVMTHSSGSIYGYRLAFEAPDLVKTVIGIEPSSLPTAYPESCKGQRFVDVMGDYLDTRPFWVTMDGGVQSNIAAVAERGAYARYMRLADKGLPNHSHMIMMDRDNNRALDVILTEAGEI